MSSNKHVPCPGYILRVVRPPPPPGGGGGWVGCTRPEKIFPIAAKPPKNFFLLRSDSAFPNGEACSALSMVAPGMDVQKPCRGTFLGIYAHVCTQKRLVWVFVGTFFGYPKKVCADPPPGGGGSGWVGTHSNPLFWTPTPPGVGQI